DAAAAGADALLLAPVSYTPLGEKEVHEHFVEVASATDLPLCIYNNPTTTHFTFSDVLIARLAAHPKIVAVKNPSAPVAENPERHAALAALLPGGFALGYSGDWNAARAVLAGGVGWYSVIAGLLPEPALKLMRAAQAGDVSEVDRINAAFGPLWGLFRELTGYRIVYAVANAMGLTDAQPPRPILPLAAADQQRVMMATRKLAEV
ncbi:MAG TPA: dihydrodipicolinate synthase family protein, partial [Phenylobacterium sp.]